MMQVIPHCPHCDKELPGWTEPVQETTGGSWGLTDPPSPQWQVCPLCKGSGASAVQLNEPSGSYPAGVICSFCHGAKVVTTP